jgi:hypothetical protein
MLLRAQREAVDVDVGSRDDAADPDVARDDRAGPNVVVVGFALGVRVGWPERGRSERVSTAGPGDRDPMLARDQVEVRESCRPRGPTRSG